MVGMVAGVAPIVNALKGRFWPPPSHGTVLPVTLPGQPSSRASVLLHRRRDADGSALG